MRTALVLAALTVLLFAQAAAPAAEWPPSAWTRLPAGGTDDVSVTLLHAPRATAADETFVAFELANASSSPITVQHVECVIEGATFDAQGKRFDGRIVLKVPAILDASRPEAGATLPPRSTIILRGDCSVAAATLGVPGMSRGVYRKGHAPRVRRVPEAGLHLEASAWVTMVARLPSAQRRERLAIALDWDPVDARGMEAVMARAADAVRRAPATHSAPDDAAGWLAIPEIAQALPTAVLLAGLDARATGWVESHRADFLIHAVRARTAERGILTAFLRERLERGSPDAIGWLLRAPDIWDESYRPAVERLARAGVVPGTGRLLVHHAQPGETAQATSSLLLAVERPAMRTGQAGGERLPDAEGLSGWLFETPEPARGAPALAGGEVLFLTSDLQVWAVDAVSGRESWHRALRADELDVPSFDVAGPTRGRLPFVSAGFPRLLGCGSHVVLLTWRFRAETTQPWLTGLDPRTGDIAWERPSGDAVLPAPGADACLVVTMAPHATSARGATSRVELVDAATGRTRWDRKLRGSLVASCVSGDAVACIVNAADHERLVVINCASGAVRTRVMEDGVPRPATWGCFAEAERIVTFTASRPESDVVMAAPPLVRCWDPRTLALSWSATPWLDPFALDQGLLVGRSTEGLIATDAASGKEKWTAPVHALDAAIGEDVAVVDWQASSSIALLDARSGAPTARMPARCSGLSQGGVMTFATTERGLLAIARARTEGGVAIVASEASRRQRARILWERPHARSYNWPPFMAAGDRVVARSGDGLVAIDAVSGATAWTMDPAPGHRVAAVAVSEEIVAVQIDDDVVGLSRATGERAWSTRLTPNSWPRLLAAGAGVVLIGASTPVAGRGLARALDASTGRLAWEMATGAQAPVAAAVRGNSAVFASFQGDLAALDVATGSALWSARAALSDGERISAMKLAGEDSSIVVLELNSSGQRVLGIHGPSGATWSIARMGAVTVDDAVLRPGIDEQRVKVFAIDALTAEPVWHSAPVPGRNGPPAILGDTLYYGSAEGHVRAVHRATRSILWTTRLSSGIHALVIAGGNVIAGCDDGRLVALRTDTP